MKVLKNNMERCLLLLFLISFALTVRGQEIVQINTTVTVSTVPKERVGINVNYLTDDNKTTKKALEELEVKFLRFPGGEKSDNYIWGQHPFDKANPTLALTGNCHWPNSDSRYTYPDFKTLKPNIMDFDEYMVLVNKTGAEPFIVVNADSHHNTGSSCGGIPLKDSLLTVAREWVRYANVVKKHNIKFWMIGNESFKSAAYAGKVTAEQYRADVIDFAKALKSIDPNIKIVVNGDTQEWWQTVLSDTVATKLIDYLGISAYPIYNWESGYMHYNNTVVDFTKAVRIANQAINQFVKNPEDKERIKIIVTETNALDFGNAGWPNTNDIGHALVLFDIIGQHLLAPKVEYTFYWNTRWIDNKNNNRGYNAINQEGHLLANGKALKIWNKFLLESMVAASNTQHVVSYATRNKRQLTVFLLNKDTLEHKVKLEIYGFESQGNLGRYLLTGTALTDTIPQITVAPNIMAIPKTQNRHYNVSLLPYSITVLRYRAKAASSILTLSIETWALLVLFLTTIYQYGIRRHNHKSLRGNKNRKINKLTAT